MKRLYKSPTLEVYLYQVEEGYSTTIALERDHVLIEGNDQTTLRSSEEFTSYADEDGEYVTGSFSYPQGD